MHIRTHTSPNTANASTDSLTTIAAFYHTFSFHLIISVFVPFEVCFLLVCIILSTPLFLYDYLSHTLKTVIIRLHLRELLNQ